MQKVVSVILNNKRFLKNDFLKHESLGFNKNYQKKFDEDLKK